jgi:acetylornithine/succinyldiaminopimelate/putrescine aminotransferase
MADCLYLGTRKGLMMYERAGDGWTHRTTAFLGSFGEAKTFFHGHSFTANPIACAAAVASWNCLQSGQWKADVKRIEAFWESRIRLLADSPGVKSVRIRGLIAAVELDVTAASCSAPSATCCMRCRRSARPTSHSTASPMRCLTQCARHSPEARLRLPNFRERSLIPRVRPALARRMRP